MDAVREMLDDLRTRPLIQGQFLALLHILIGRRISRPDGTLISAGLTWRQVAELLKRVRWEPNFALEAGIALADLPQRDRQRFWYAVITLAKVDSPEVTAAADRLADQLAPLGYIAGPAPGSASS